MRAHPALAPGTLFLLGAPCVFPTFKSFPPALAFPPTVFASPPQLSLSASHSHHNSHCVLDSVLPAFHPSLVSATLGIYSEAVKKSEKP